MKGTEKQIKWAQDIISKLDQMIDYMIEDAERFEKEGICLITLHYTADDMRQVKTDLMATVNKMDAAQIIAKRNVFSNRDMIKATAVKYHAM